MTILNRHDNSGGDENDTDIAEWRTRLYFQTPLRKHNTGDIRLLTIQPPPSRKQGAATTATASPSSDNNNNNNNTIGTISCFLRLENIVKNTPKFTAISRHSHFYPYPSHQQSSNENKRSSNDDDDDDDDDDPAEEGDEGGKEGDHASPSPSADTDTTVTIMVNGGPVPIARDLAAALEHLRREGYGNGDTADAEPVVVWAAELCVNGADPAERSVQAALTAAIFAGASRVLAWLSDTTLSGGHGGGRGVCEALEALKCLSTEEHQGQGGIASHTGNGWLSWDTPTAVGSQLARSAWSVAGMAGAVTIAAPRNSGSGSREVEKGGGDKNREKTTQADDQGQRTKPQTQTPPPLHEHLDALRVPLRAILNHSYWTRAWSLVELAAATAGTTPPSTSTVEIGVVCFGRQQYHNYHYHHRDTTIIDLAQFHVALKALDAALNSATVTKWLASNDSRTGTAGKKLLATSEPADLAARSPALRLLDERAFHADARHLVALRKQGGWSHVVVNPWSYIPSSLSHQPPSASAPLSTSTPYSEPGHDLLSLIIRYFYLRRQHSKPEQTDSSTLAFFSGGDGGSVADPRDTLYALMNLASDAAELGVLPDYSKSWAHVRAETSAALLKRSARPLALCVGVSESAAVVDEDDNETLQTPSSWMLDWTTGTAAAPMAHVVAPEFSTAAAGHRSPNPFKACGPADDRFYRAEVEVDNTTGVPISVVVKGAVVGTVKEVGKAIPATTTTTTTTVPIDADTDVETSSSPTPQSTLERYRGYLTDISRLWEEALSLNTGNINKSPYAPEQSKVALAKISIADAEVASSGSAAGRVHRATSLSFEGYQWLVRALEATGSDTTTQKKTAGGREEEDPRRLFQGYLESLDRSAGRRPFLTDSGYAGTGPLDLEADDIVVVPYGSLVPVALRSCGGGEGEGGRGRYRIVGAVYVFGIMDGEFMKVHRKEAVLRLC